MFVFKSSDIRRKGQRRLATIVGDYPPFQINLIVTVLHAAAAPLKANCQQEENRKKTLADFHEKLGFSLQS